MYRLYSHQQAAAISQQAAVVVSNQQPFAEPASKGSEWFVVTGPWSGVTAQAPLALRWQIRRWRGRRWSVSSGPRAVRGPRSMVRGHSPAALA